MARYSYCVGNVGIHILSLAHGISYVQVRGRSQSEFVDKYSDCRGVVDNGNCVRYDGDVVLRNRRVYHRGDVGIDSTPYRALQGRRLI